MIYIETFYNNKIPLFLQVPQLNSEIYKLMAGKNDGLGYLNFKMIT